MLSLLVILLSANLVSSYLEPGFLAWITINKGADVATKLNRSDYSLYSGSFGGGPGPLTYRPLVLVHGRANDAGQLALNRESFIAAGWNGQHVLATTYGVGNVQGDVNDRMTCNNVQHVRWMLESVIGYYNSSIDVMAYSMGSPISRKAIMGGLCIDNAAINLGPSLSSSIITFVSVAGANEGAKQCDNFFFSLVAPACNNGQTGLKCSSTFFLDATKGINVASGNEGTYRHYIYSNGDDVVGTSVSCNARNPAFLPGTTNATSLSGNPNHSATLFDRRTEQVNVMLTYRSLL